MVSTVVNPPQPQPSLHHPKPQKYTQHTNTQKYTYIFKDTKIPTLSLWGKTNEKKEYKHTNISQHFVMELKQMQKYRRNAREKPRKEIWTSLTRKQTKMSIVVTTQPIHNQRFTIIPTHSSTVENSLLSRQYSNYFPFTQLLNRIRTIL